MLASLFLLFLVPGSWQKYPVKPPSFPGLPTVKDLAEAAGYSATDVEVMTEDGYSLWMHRIGNSSGPPVMLHHGWLTAGECWITRGPDKDLDLAEAAGYSATDVEVMTEDGYSLWMHRIGNSSGPPVMLHHGWLTAGECWITRGPDKDLAFLLLKAGFDVWLTNQRGTVYNQYNLKYSRTDPRFWNFSFHEAGYYDIPAFIDRILTIRKAKKIFFVGHSLGATVFLVMNSLRPEYNSKIHGAVLLAPVSYAPSSDALGPNPFFRFAVNNADAIYAGLINGRIYEVMPRTSTNIKTIKQICSNLSPSQELCLDIIGIFTGDHRSNIDKENLGNSMMYAFAGTSSKTFYHVFQIYKTGEFKQFDYGPKGNWINYNNSTSPSYPLERVVAPVIIFWSYNDPFISEESIGKLASKLPNLIKMKTVPDPKFTHVDMIWGENAKFIVYPDVIGIFHSMIRKDKS